jgi:hypothetical protein
MKFNQNCFIKFLFSETSSPAVGLTKLTVQRVTGSLQRVKWLGREFYHVSPCSAEVKNEWSYTSTPPVGLHVTQGDDVTFTYLKQDFFDMCWFKKIYAGFISCAVQLLSSGQ